MTDSRMIAVDLMARINDAVSEGLENGNPVSFGEILFALRVCAAVVVSEIPESHRTGYVQDHMLATAEMLGIPLIPMEVDMPSKGSMN